MLDAHNKCLGVHAWHAHPGGTCMACSSRHMHLWLCVAGCCRCAALWAAIQPTCWLVAILLMFYFLWRHTPQFIHHHHHHVTAKLVIDSVKDEVLLSVADGQYQYCCCMDAR
jgi:hypothetical protein